MFRAIHYWFEDHELLGAIIKIMFFAAILGVVLGFVSGGVATIAGYGYLLRPFVCWAIGFCVALGALFCLLLMLYAAIVPKM